MLNYFQIQPLWPTVFFYLAVLMLFFFESKRAVYYISKLKIKQCYRLFCKNPVPVAPQTQKKGCTVDICSLVMWICGFVIIYQNSAYLSVFEAFVCVAVLVFLPWFLKMFMRLLWCVLMGLYFLAGQFFLDN